MIQRKKPYLRTKEKFVLDLDTRLTCQQCLKKVGLYTPCPCIHSGHRDPNFLLVTDKEDTRNLETLEELAWEPNRLSEPQINRFLLVSRWAVKPGYSLHFRYFEVG